MNIETKFSVFDSVLYMEGNRIVINEITSVEAKSFYVSAPQGGSMVVRVQYEFLDDDGESTWKSEAACFDSMDAILKHLQNKFKEEYDNDNEDYEPDCSPAGERM